MIRRGSLAPRAGFLVRPHSLRALASNQAGARRATPEHALAGMRRQVQRTLEGRNVMIFPKVRVADVLEPVSGGLAGFNRISQKHVDYLLVSLPDFQPVLAIESDGKSHGSQKQQARDAIKDQAFKSAGMPLVRVRVSRDLSDLMLLSMLEPHLKPVPLMSNARKSVSRQS